MTDQNMNTDTLSLLDDEDPTPGEVIDAEFQVIEKTTPKIAGPIRLREQITEKRDQISAALNRVAVLRAELDGLVDYAIDRIYQPEILVMLAEPPGPKTVPVPVETQTVPGPQYDIAYPAAKTQPSGSLSMDLLGLKGAVPAALRAAGILTFADWDGAAQAGRLGNIPGLGAKKINKIKDAILVFMSQYHEGMNPGRKIDAEPYRESVVAEKSPDLTGEDDELESLAYTTGREAREDDQPRKENPYAKHTKFNHAFDRGWFDRDSEFEQVASTFPGAEDPSPNVPAAPDLDLNLVD